MLEIAVSSAINLAGDITIEVRALTVSLGMTHLDAWRRALEYLAADAEDDGARDVARAIASEIDLAMQGAARADHETTIPVTYLRELVNPKAAVARAIVRGAAQIIGQLFAEQIEARAAVATAERML